MPTLLISLLALWICQAIVSQRAASLFVTGAFEPSFESGKWAIRYLLVSLSMTPLKTYLGLRQASRFRKPAGLWAFGFAMLHMLLTLEHNIGWLDLPLQPFIALGLLGLAILATLSITSNRASMRRLGKNWKRLHRTVYIAGGAVILHAIMATASSKLLLLREPNTLEELNVYAAVLTILLIVRIPLVKGLILSSPIRPFRRPQAVPLERSVEHPVSFPTKIVSDWSRVAERNAALSPEEENEPKHIEKEKQTAGSLT